MTRKPYFSVVMPTYNRAQFLPLAIKSVLGQTFEDFEVIVCNGGSTDNTRDIVADFTDSRIRYIEAKERLSIGENYQTALNQANGEYITFLSDDDAFAPIMFERVKSVIEERKASIVAFQFCNYYQDNYIEFDGRAIYSNTLAIPSFTKEVKRFSASESLGFLFGNQGLNKIKPHEKFITPYLANAVYHHEVFSKIKKKNKNMFSATPADMYLAAAVFFVVDNYFCLDEPLHVWSRWAGSATASPREQGNKLKEHYRNLLNGHPISFTPLQNTFPRNCIINALLEAKNDFQNEVNVEIDWSEYFVTTYRYLMELKDFGVGISDEFQEFEDVLLKQSKDLQQKVNSQTINFKKRIKQLFRDKIPFSKKILKKVRKPVNESNLILVNGNEGNFTNFLEAARFLVSNTTRISRINNSRLNDEN